MQWERTQRFAILDFGFWIVNLTQNRTSKFQIDMGRRRGKVREQAGLRPKLSGKRIVAKTASLERRPLILDLQFWIWDWQKAVINPKSEIGCRTEGVQSLRFRTERTGTFFECPFLFGRLAHRNVERSTFEPISPHTEPA